MGRSPILSFICAQALRYWLRIVNLEQDRILKDAYLSEIQVAKNGGSSWINFIINILEIADAKDLWQRQGSGIMVDKNSIQALKFKVHKCITKYYYDNEFKRINYHSKLRTYVSFKNTYTLENYVNVHDIPLS